MELQIGDSFLQFDSASSSVRISGSMRLPNMQEYDHVMQFLKQSAEMATDTYLIDVTDLKFLNSSGITTISLFVIHISKTGNPKLTIKGRKDVPWHNKSLSNFKKLWKEVTIALD